MCLIVTDILKKRNSYPETCQNCNVRPLKAVWPMYKSFSLKWRPFLHLYNIWGSPPRGLKGKCRIVQSRRKSTFSYTWFRTYTMSCDRIDAAALTTTRQTNMKRIAKFLTIKHHARDWGFFTRYHNNFIWSGTERRGVIFLLCKNIARNIPVSESFGNCYNWPYRYWIEISVSNGAML